MYGNDVGHHANPLSTRSALERGGGYPSSSVSNSNLANDLEDQSLLMVSATTVELRSLSFGAAVDYHRAGGQAVIADDAPDTAPRDLAVEGLLVPRGLGDGGRATAAFVIASKSIRIRATFAAAVDGYPRRAFVRAFAGGQERVHEFVGSPGTELEFAL